MKINKQKQPLYILGAVFAILIIVFLFKGNNDTALPESSVESIDKTQENNKQTISDNTKQENSNSSETRGVGALGRIEPRSRVITVSHDAGPEGARIGKLLISEGQKVQMGDVIAYFSDYSRKKAELVAAEANLDVLKGKLEAQLAENAIAQREYERTKKLLKNNVVAEAKKDEVELRFRQAKANTVSLQAEIKSSDANLALTKEKLQQSILTAPINGTILKIHSFPGERVSDAGVVEMADLTQMDVVAEVYERDISKVKQGQGAEIFVPGMDGAIPGVVREVGFQVKKNDVNDTDPLADRDNRIVEVRIGIPEEKAEPLKHLIYMQVNVRIGGNS